ncbi:MAG: NUDIX domain-containing protein [Chloroflexia bacterium]
MQPDLAAFLACHTPRAEEEAVWGEGTITIRLLISCYLSTELPPLEYVTSVRSLVFQGNSVLVLRNPDDIHIYPGGRREGGETLEETLRREILEEVGWEVVEIARLGFLHFQHLTPKPEGYLYSYPHFMHVVYMAKASHFMPGAKLEDDYELEAAFRPISEVREMPLSPCQHVFLKAALEAHT